MQPSGLPSLPQDSADLSWWGLEICAPLGQAWLQLPGTRRLYSIPAGTGCSTSREGLDFAVGWLQYTHAGWDFGVPCGCGGRDYRDVPENAVTHLRLCLFAKDGKSDNSFSLTKCTCFASFFHSHFPWQAVTTPHTHTHTWVISMRSAVTVPPQTPTGIPAEMPCSTRFLICFVPLGKCPLTALMNEGRIAAE